MLNPLKIKGLMQQAQAAQEQIIAAHAALVAKEFTVTSEEQDEGWTLNVTVLGTGDLVSLVWPSPPPYWTSKVDEFVVLTINGAMQRARSEVQAELTRILSAVNMPE